MAFDSIFSGALGGGAAGSAIPGIGTAIGAGLGALGGLFSFIGKDAQAEQQRREALEQARRQDARLTQQYGSAVNIAAGSGADITSVSLQSYLQSMRDEMARQRDWASQQTQANYSNQEMGAGIGLFTDLGSTMFQFAKNNSWWQKGGP